jgi:hypothetical protein
VSSADLDHVLDDEQPPVQQVDAAAPERRQLTPAKALVAHEAHRQPVWRLNFVGDPLDQRGLEPGTLLLGDGRERDAAGPDWPP